MGRRGTHTEENDQFLTSGTVKHINTKESTQGTGPLLSQGNFEPYGNQQIQYKEKPFSLNQSTHENDMNNQQTIQESNQGGIHKLTTIELPEDKRTMPQTCETTITHNDRGKSSFDQDIKHDKSDRSIGNLNKAKDRINEMVHELGLNDIEEPEEEVQRN
jgi:hypothetical protein